MKLNDEERDMLAGKAGPLPQRALRHQIKVGDFFGAADFVAVTQAHVMADTESLGEAGVQWLEGLAAATSGQRRVRKPLPALRPTRTRLLPVSLIPPARPVAPPIGCHP